MIPLKLKLLGFILSLLFGGVLFFSVLKKKIRVENVSFWIFLPIGLAIVSLFYDQLVLPVADFLEIKISFLLLILLAFFYSYFLLFRIYIHFSQMGLAIKNLSQKIAILEDELEIAKRKE